MACLKSLSSSSLGFGPLCQDQIAAECVVENILALLFHNKNKEAMGTLVHGKHCLQKVSWQFVENF